MIRLFADDNTDLTNDSGTIRDMSEIYVRISN
jgi:hypothetical protein